MMWLSHIERVATQHLPLFLKQQWYIIEAHPDVEWPTSDDPVIWTRKYIAKGVEIVFPISPKYLLYSRIGHKFCASEIAKIQKNQTFSQNVWKRILENGFLYIYSRQRQKGMFQNCPRAVNETEYNRVHKLLFGRNNEWSSTNSSAEINFLTKDEMST